VEPRVARAAVTVVLLLAGCISSNSVGPAMTVAPTGASTGAQVLPYSLYPHLRH
jgi:outer membrane murein-binding lipoprotein Lpp